MTSPRYHSYVLGDFQNLYEYETSNAPLWFLIYFLMMFVGHPEPEAIPSAAKGRIGEASAD